MEFFKKYDQAAFLRHLPKIRQRPDAWQAVQVSLSGKTGHNIFYLARRIQRYFAATEGLIFVCSNKEILAFTMTGGDAVSLASAVRCALPEYSCEVQSTQLTPDGLLNIQLHIGALGQGDGAGFVQDASLMSLRRERDETIFFVADDDKFIRSVICKALAPRGKIIEFESGEGIVDSYLDILPDIVFADIHLPDATGFEILTEILAYDETAYIAIMSSDVVKENILAARNKGAKHFVAKPFTREKLEECCAGCPSLKKDAKTSKSLPG